MLKLNLFCGPHILTGWYNYDVDYYPGGKAHDVRNGIPHSNQSIDYIYLEHGIEHLNKNEIKSFLKECHRVLKSGGVIRISTPDLETIMEDYKNKKIDRWSPGWNPESPCEMVNHGLSLWGHKYVMDLHELSTLLLDAGFNQIDRVLWRQSKHPDLSNLEVRPDCKDLIVEAIKH